MKTSTRILTLLQAIAMVILTVILLVAPEIGPDLIALILGITLIVFGIRSLINYISKFRFMVRGKMSLYAGVIGLDLGLLVLHTYRGSNTLILLYLLGFRLLTGVIDIARAVQSKKIGGRWKMQLVSGIINVGVAIIGVIFIRHPLTMVYIYCVGLVISAIEKFISVFKKTAMQYIA